MEPNSFTRRVHDLEDKYIRNGRTSFMFVPPVEIKAFYRFRDRYFKDNRTENVRISWTKEKNLALNKLLGGIDHANMTVEQITDLANKNDVLTDSGAHFYSQNNVYGWLRYHHMTYKRVYAARKRQNRNKQVCLKKES